MKTTKTFGLCLVVFLSLNAAGYCETISLSGASQVEDVVLNADYANYNIGGGSDLSVGMWTVGDLSNTHSLIRFLGLDAYKGQTVQSATLKLYYVPQTDQTENTTLQVHSITAANQSWLEGTNTIWNWPQPGDPDGASCWNRLRFNNIAWAGSSGCSTSGTDYSSALAGSKVVRTLDIGWIELDISASLVQDWIDDYSAGEKNPGLLLRDAQDGVAGYQLLFKSSESAESPILEVTFVPEPTAMAVIFTGILNMVAFKRRK